MPRRTTTSQERPTKEQILDYIETSTGRVGKREIARAFRLAGPDRIWLKSVLKELEQERQLERHRGRRVSRAGRLPEVTVIRISHIDEDGEVVAHPFSWQDEDGDPPTIYL
ncbi:MAG: ribonuclease R, partial [Pseudomonadota bacterium]|nr:ribonuclease R [Pseudomonadota bacterium]